MLLPLPPLLLLLTVLSGVGAAYDRGRRRAGGGVGDHGEGIGEALRGGGDGDGSGPDHAGVGHTGGDGVGGCARAGDDKRVKVQPDLADVVGGRADVGRTLAGRGEVGALEVAAVLAGGVATTEGDLRRGAGAKKVYNMD